MRSARSDGTSAIALHGSIASNRCVRYTLRRIPKTVDAALRRRAKAQGRSLNATAVEALAIGLGLSKHDEARRDLSDIAGQWCEDSAFDAAVEAQDQIDPPWRSS